MANRFEALMNESNKENKDYLKSKEPVPEKKLAVKKEQPAAPKEEKPKKKTYSGKEKPVTLILSEENAQYLQFKAARTGRTMKKFFYDIMDKSINQVMKGEINLEDEIAQKYMQRQSKAEKRTITVQEDMITAIKECAMKYQMKYTNFIAFSIEKERLNDKDW